nr:MAG: hypothetical protein E4H34_05705 [Hyphomicrobiales bacterium]
MERNRDKPGFAANKFYLGAAALLFFLGYTYNINRASLGIMDIFQGVAMCTVVVYLLMRTRIPTWLHLVIMAAMYGVYLAFRIRLEMNLILPNFTELKASIPSGADFTHPAIMNAMKAVVGDLGFVRRFLFVHFGLFAWISYFYMGALCYRSVTARAGVAWRWAIFFLVLCVSAPFLLRDIFPRMFLDSYIDLMLRAIPSYVFLTLGGAGLAYLLSRRYYRGAINYRNRVGKWVAGRLEMLGKESLMFLVVHWWMISTVMLVVKIFNAPANFRGLPGWDLNIYFRSLIVMAGVIYLVPWLAKLRDRWSRTGSYGLKVGVVMFASIVLAVMVLFAAPPLAHYLTYGSSLGFAFLYPYLRGRLRKRYTKKVSTAPEV